MVSIHRVSVIAYLIIRVIYFTFRFKRGGVFLSYSLMKALDCLGNQIRQHAPRL